MVSQAICTYMDKNKGLNDMCVSVATKLNLLCCCTQRDSFCGIEQLFHIVNTQFLICAINNMKKMEACLCLPFMALYSINHKGSPHFYCSIRKGLIYWFVNGCREPAITPPHSPSLPGSYQRHLMVIMTATHSETLNLCACETSKGWPGSEQLAAFPCSISHCLFLYF